MREIDVLLRDLKRYGNAERDCAISAEDALAIAAALEAAREDAWQPIATAPRDGRQMILLLTPSRFPQVAFSNTWWTAGFSVECKPTHWRRIEPMPAIDQARGKGVADEAEDREP